MKNLLKKLAEFEPTGFPVLNLVLDTGVNENGKTTHEIFVRDQLREAEGKYEEGTSEYESFQKDVEKINTFLEKIRPETETVTIFACAGANDFFETLQLAVPVDENFFAVTERPQMRQLAQIRDRNPRVAAVLADTNSAQIFLFGRGRRLAQQEIEGTKTNRSEVGGWSQMRYQRHVDNFHQQHARETIGELTELARKENIEYIVLSGNQAVTRRRAALPAQGRGARGAGPRTGKALAGFT